MTEVFSVPASTSLFAEFNALAPGRRRTQDGTIGDRAHMERNSDHNLDEIGNTGSHSDTDTIPEVHARDIDSRGPWPTGWSMERVVQIILARCRSGAEKRLLYIIYNGRIWEASNGWTQRTYTGTDQHREHAHFSFRYGSGSGTSNPENITSPWGFLAAYQAEDEHVDANDVKLFLTTDGLIATPSNASDLKTNPKRTVADSLSNIEYHVRATEAQIAALGGSLAAAIAALGSKDQVDEAALAQELVPGIVAGVLAGLPQAGDVSADELQAAILGALRQLAQ